MKKIHLIILFIAFSYFSPAQDHYTVFGGSPGDNAASLLDKGYSFVETTMLQTSSGEKMHMYSYKISDEDNPLRFIIYNIVYNSKNKVFEVNILTHEKKMYDVYIDYCKRGKKMDTDYSFNEECFVDGFFINIETINNEGLLFYLIRIQK